MPEQPPEIRSMTGRYPDMAETPGQTITRLERENADLLVMLKRALAGLREWERDQREYHPQSVDGWLLIEQVEQAIARAEGRTSARPPGPERAPSPPPGRKRA
jgi:hypothetical protein